MGVVKEEEPPSKRVKLSSGGSGGLLDKAYLGVPADCSLSGSMARPLESEGDSEVVGPKGMIKKTEFVRIIAEALYSLGYKKSGEHLEEESGIPLHSHVVNLFTQKILDGNWDESVVLLHKIGLADESVTKLASCIILEQKFFELLDKENFLDALKTLRSEIAPLFVSSDRVRELSSFMVSGSRQDNLTPKSRSKLLEELQMIFPPMVMIPDKRLVHLVEQALDLQKDACRFHNSGMGEMSLLTNHQCGCDQIPSNTLQILHEHNDEVWFLQFSHDGNYLASSSNDQTVIIWEVTIDGRVFFKRRLTGHRKAVSFISWGPTDNHILTCGVEEAVRLWDVSSGECLYIFEKPGLGTVSCGWTPDGKRVFTSLTDRSISMWDLEGIELECWKGQRTVKISDLLITNDGKQIIVACKDSTILLFEWESKTENFIEEEQPIISFSLSKDSKFLLVNLLNQEIHVWNISGDIKLIAKYKGHKRSRFVVRSCFGGYEQAFVASGSEDSQVYIWHRRSGELIMTLPGHSGTVNCVSWNPKNHQMLASASDDGTIRVWGSSSQVKKQLCNGMKSQSNGVHLYCNGGT